MTNMLKINVITQNVERALRSAEVNFDVYVSPGQLTIMLPGHILNYHFGEFDWNLFYFDLIEYLDGIDWE